MTAANPEDERVTNEGQGTDLRLVLLRQLPTSIQSASRKDRQTLFSELTIELVQSHKPWEQPVKVAVLQRLAKYLVLTPLRYQDDASRSCVRRFLCQSLDRYGKDFATPLIKHIDAQLAGFYVSGRACLLYSRICIDLLAWLEHVPQAMDLAELDYETTQAYVRCLALIVSIIVVYQHPIHLQKLHNHFDLFHSRHSKYVAVLCHHLSGFQADQHPLEQFALWAFLLVTPESNSTDLFEQYLGHVLDLLIKQVIPSRVCLEKTLLTANRSTFLARLISESIFVQQLLPAFQKALLRNPEVAFEFLLPILQFCRFEVDDQIAVLAKMVATQLISKQESLEELGVGVSRQLALKSKQKTSLLKLIQHYATVYNGSEGKLSTVQQRRSLSSAVGIIANCHANFDDQKLQEIAEAAIQALISFTKNESHETTLLHIATQLTDWAENLKLSVPNDLINWYKTAMAAKNTTSPVRSAFTAVIKSALNTNTVSQIVPLLPNLATSLSKVSTIAFGQQGLLIEALQNLNLFLKLFELDESKRTQFEHVINVAIAVDKLQFLNEKFIAAAPHEALNELCFFIQHLLTLFQGKLNSKQNVLIASLIQLAVYRSSFDVRNRALATYEHLSRTIDSSLLLKNFTYEFTKEFIDLPESEIDTEPENSSLSASALIDAVRRVASAPNLNTSKDEIVFELFTICHLPVVHAKNPNLWYSLAKKLLGEQNVQPFVENKVQSLYDRSFELSNLRLQHNCVYTLSSLFPENFLPKLIERVLSVWDNADIASVTRRDFEIFCTPTGELYDTSVIDQAKEHIDIKNMRKENKLYSYQEQMEELKLRKELEAKKKPELTKKQLQAKQEQLNKESVIRSNVAALHEQFIQSVNIVNAMVDGNRLFLSFHLKSLLPKLLAHLQSPLCAAELSKLYMRLHRCVWEHGEIGCAVQMVQAIILRQLNPICALESRYEQLPLEEIEEKLLQRLYDYICGSKSDDNFDSAANKTALRPTTFTLILPFFTHLLVQRKRLDHILEQCLEIISVQVQQEFDELIDEVEDLTWNPVHLARRTLLALLIQVIEKRGVIAAKEASKVFLETATCIAEYPDTEGSGELKQIVQLFVDSLQSSHELVRSVNLEALLLLQDPIKVLLKEDIELGSIAMHRLWVAQFDTNEACSALACDFWISCELKAESRIANAILSELKTAKYELLEAIACALFAILREHPNEISTSLKTLIDFYTQIAPKSFSMFDAFGRPLHDMQADHYYPRMGAALILTKLAPLIPVEMITTLTRFHVPLALSDINSEVRQQMLEAMVALIQNTQPDRLKSILTILQTYLDEVASSEETDRVRTSVVVLMGRLAGRLNKNDPNIKPIIGKLIETLSTPSQMVQQAVSNCLPDLCPCIEQEAETLVDNLIKLLLDSDNYGEKKGAAYGIAGLVSGLGILSMRNITIIDRCLKAIHNKKSNRKLGGLIAFEVFCTVLGPRFEPYVVCLIPGLLASYGDTSENIRRAAQTTSRAIMNSLSERGVRYILPSLLAGLNSENWRTKVGSIEILAAMAYCAPRQLSSCLPTIVPKLMEVLCDSHSSVQQAANQALQQIGSVIRNPEIAAIVPTLLQALDDPANKTQSCLVTMLNTKFVHIIDAPSLALIMPVIERAFQARSTTTRKMAAQIIGNMYSLTDQQDLAPYMPAIIPGIKQSLLDPVPDVRAATARALGAMVRGIGDQVIGDILPWLMTTLTSEASSVDRSGAAQGLAEVIGGLGVQRLNKLMPEIIATSARVDISPFVKDGYLMLYIYLPIVFTAEFTNYIGKIIHPILKALADENEFVRETAFKAGQRIVALYANSSIQLLLPELEKGLFDENWRIRYSSVQLLGDLLYKISGVSGKMTTETAGDDDNFGTEKSCRAIMSILGNERRNRVLSGLYMGRMDVSHQVRTAALHVWKIIVSNTPRTLKEILPTLFSLLLGCLASKSTDQQQVAARTLGDLVRKLGERILPQIIPILEEKLRSNRSDERQGVCIGLSEIIANTSKEMVEAFVFSLVPTVRKALCDPLPEVRQAAASTFDSLYNAVGVRALEEIIPFLLQRLQDPQEGDFVLDGLRNVLSVRGQAVLPYLIPQLTVPPVNPRALSLLSSVSGEAMGRHLLKLLPALMGVLRDAVNEDARLAQLELCQLALSCVQEESSVQTLVDYLLGVCKQPKNTSNRYAAALLLQSYCASTKCALTPFVPQLLRGLIALFVCDEPNLLNVCWDALQAVVKAVPKAQLGEFASELRSAIRFALSDYKSMLAQSNGHGSSMTAKPVNTVLSNASSQPVPAYVNELVLPGFSLPRGIGPVLSIYREAMVSGGREHKEAAAISMCELLKICSPEALRSSVMNIAGPLIRMLAERVTSELKIAILDNLSMLMYKDMGQYVKPFLPQLQQSLVRCALDTYRHVRLRAAGTVAQLLYIHSRPDAVMIELNQHLRTCINNPSGGGAPMVFGSSPACDEVAETLCNIIRITANVVGQRMTGPVRAQLIESVNLLLNHSLDSMRLTAGSALGALSKQMSDQEFALFAKQVLSEDESGDWTLRHGRSIAFWIALKENSERLLSTPESSDRVQRVLSRLIASDRLQFVICGVKGTTYLIEHRIRIGATTGLLTPALLTQYTRTMNHVTNEVKSVLLQGTVYLARSFVETLPTELLKPLIPMLVNGTKEKNTMIRANSEQALVCVLKLRTGDEHLQKVYDMLDAGPRESLQMCVSKTLRRVVQQAEPKGTDKFDDSILM